MKIPKIQSHAATDIGRSRAINQDFIFSFPSPMGKFPNLFILADGMGGHKAGDYASKHLVNYIVNWIRQCKSNSNIAILRDAIEFANSELYKISLSDSKFSGMGSTLVVAFIEENILTVANVGDSRLYVIGKDSIAQITKDHSLVEELVRKEGLSRDSEYYRQHKNIITRAIGTGFYIKADFFEEELNYGDYVLLCSDGLTNMVSDEEIFKIVKSNDSLGNKVNTLIQLANDSGGNDNISVILIRYIESSVE